MLPSIALFSSHVLLSLLHPVILVLTVSVIFLLSCVSLRFCTSSSHASLLFQLVPVSPAIYFSLSQFRLQPFLSHLSLLLHHSPSSDPSIGPILYRLTLVSSLNLILRHSFPIWPFFCPLPPHPTFHLPPIHPRSKEGRGIYLLTECALCYVLLLSYPILLGPSRPLFHPLRVFPSIVHSFQGDRRRHKLAKARDSSFDSRRTTPQTISGSPAVLGKRNDALVAYTWWMEAFLFFFLFHIHFSYFNILFSYHSLLFCVSFFYSLCRVFTSNFLFCSLFFSFLFALRLP